MTDIRGKLDALLAGKGVMSGADWKRSVEETRRRRDAGEFEVDRVLDGGIVENDSGRFFLVRRDYPLDSVQGAVALDAVLRAAPEHVAFSASDEELLSFNPRTAFFMDTETTGLAGGAGTVAFLVGVGFFVDNAFRLEQCFMRDYDEEEAMLRYLSGLFRSCETVVSYNGKSFDLPLLRTRFIQNRVPFLLDGAAHFDLLHAARRFWKLRLKDCSLGSVERSVLGVHRQGDVPSSEIPQLWLDYLHTRDARKLKGVFYHHEMDIVSLVALTGWLSQCLSEPDGAGFSHAEDRVSVLRMHVRQRRYAKAVQHGEKLLEGDLDRALRRECLTTVAFALKRLREWDRMADYWACVLQEYPKDLCARLELAKYQEHVARDLEAARATCADAVTLLQTRLELGRGDDLARRELAAFQHRLARLDRKLGRARGGDSLFD